MNRYRVSAISRGIGVALLRRALYIILGLVVLQLVTLQFTVDTGEVRQQKDANARLEKALKALKEENQKTQAADREEHAKTQRYLKCIVLLPVGERTEANFAKCGVTGKPNPSIDGRTQQATSPATTPSEPSTARTSLPTTSAPPEPDTPPATAPDAPQDEEAEEQPGFIRSTVEGLLALPGRILEVVL